MTQIKKANAEKIFAKLIKAANFANHKNGELAQLARALGWQPRGHRFESDILHQKPV